ncbi:glycosyltransferase 87 family protein [Actinokineospora sp.]|uniref:glycosyltransferase 87 family protein n=1 Tax=Actinokineospora sp. TaxID=1872133 RepID=UPI0040380C3E
MPVAVIWLATGFVGTAVVWWMAGLGLGVDSSVYRAGALTLLHGDSLYAPLTTGASWAPPLPFTYPPIAAVVFVPLAAVPPQLGWGLLAAASALALGLVLRTCLPRALAHGWPFGVALLGTLALEPVWRSLALGQVNLLLMALIVADLLRLRGSRASGVLIGVAAAIKLTPLIFVAHLVLTRRWADARRALGTFAGLHLLAAAVLPGDTVRFWTEALIDGNDATTNSWIGNQSLNGLVQRVTAEGATAFALFAVLAVACLAFAAPAVRALDARGDHLGAVLVTAVAGLLVCPVSWTHHWVWVVPLAAFLLGRASTGPRVALAALAVAFAGWQFRLVPSGAKAELRWTPLDAVLGNAYVLAGLVLLAVLALHARPRRAEVVTETASRS